jgi:hypothetical protein
MKKNKLDHIWDKIADDLSLQYQESNREALIKAIQNLPNYKAPAKVWLNIEAELSKPSKIKKLPQVYAIAASLCLLLGLGYVVMKSIVNSSDKVHYTKVENYNNNLYEIADTTSSVFTKILNSTCGIKPSYCASAEFKNFEKEYKNLELMQAKILNQAHQYDNENELESMLLKIENQKKSIEQHLIEQIKS